MSAIADVPAPAPPLDLAPSDASRPKLTNSVKALYATGSIASGLKLAALSSILLPFLNQVVGFDPIAVGTLLFIATVVDAVLDPLIGHWSDMTRSRYGRRHGFMFAAALPASVAFLLLWNPPYDWDKGTLFIYMAALILILRLTISFYEVPNVSLAPELAPDYDERTKLLAWRWTFGAMGTLVMVVLVYMYLLTPSAKYPIGILNRDGYSAYGIVAAIVIFASILISAQGTRRFIPWLNKPPPRNISMRQMTRDVIASLKNWNFFVMVVTGLVGAIGTGMTAGLVIYINLYFWKLSTPSIGFLVVASTLSTLLAFVVAPGISRRFGKRNSTVVLFFISWAFANWPLVAGLMGLMPPAGSTELFTVLVVNTFFTGAFATSGFIIVTSMIADIVEDSQVATGRRSEGLLLSADTVLQKSVSGAGQLLAAVVVALAHFPIGADPRTIDPEVTRNLVLYSLPITATVSFISIALIRLYRIDRAKHEANLAKVGLIDPAERENPVG